MPEHASWWMKLRRAEHHLVDLYRVVAEYVAADPYFVRKGLEGHGKRARTVHRLVIEQPSSDLLLPCILGDFLFNVRSALDHVVVGSVNPRKHRKHASFPIFTRNIWEKDGNGGNLKKYEVDRGNWNTWTAGLSDEAKAIVEGAQPYHAVNPHPQNLGPESQVFAILGSRHNADKHRESNITGGVLHLTGMTLIVDGWPREMPLGKPEPPSTRHLIDDGAEVPIAGGDSSTVEAKLRGSVEVVIDSGGKPHYWGLKTLDDILAAAHRRVAALDALL